MSGASGQPFSVGESVEEFLAVADEFHLGALTTEQPHPLTTHLSDQARADLPAAIAALKEVDRLALRELESCAEKLGPLAESLAATLAAGKRVFLCGCGATGRLSISLEIFARQGLLGAATGDRVVAFMAGGDAALVRSIERFEDYPEYGVRQLQELGFADGDLLVGITEGGETPFVIGATEEAARSSSNRPWFLYCNPDEVLARVAARSRRVLNDDRIRKVNLTVGPMAVTGSTRMQASTVQMAAAGWALACRERPGEIGAEIAAFREWMEGTDFQVLAPFIECEASAYERRGYVLYEPGEFGITVLTDTTERAPTFSLAPFENVRNPADVPSGCYLHVAGAPDSASAWRSLLGRAPRTLSWGGLEHLTGEGNLLGFDFSDQTVERRERLGSHLHFRLTDQPDAVAMDLTGCSSRIAAVGRSPFARHLLLKLLLNTHSTLVMGRLGRFEGNVMTHVIATNRKLIDRSIRYVRMLLEAKHGLTVAYEEVARVLFAVKAGLQRGEPVVLKTVEAILGGEGGPGGS